MKEEILFTDGYDARAPEMRPDGAGNNILGFGSENLLYQGVAHLEAFKGLTITSPVTGGRTMFNFSTGYVSLNDYDPGSGNIQGLGSVFISFGKTLWFVGAGKVYWNGADLSATATSTLSFRKLVGGVYTGTTINAGLTAPSAPTVAARTTGFGGGLTGLLSGTYSVRLTRIRSTSGGESVGSLPSAVIMVTAGTMRITFPAVGSNSEDRFGIYCTQAGFGLSGPYLLLQEIAETAIQRSAADYVVSNASPNVASATAAFTPADVGKHFTLSGGSTVPAGTTVLTYTDPTHIILSANVTTGGSGRTGTLTAYTDLVDRSVEFEWSDGGLLPILVPTDNYPPPACTHAVQLEDVTLAIGCYGDGAAVTGSDGTLGVSGTGGNAIAESLAGFPEAYPPEQLLFLPEAPVHVLQRPADRYAYVLMRNAVGALTYTGGTPPVSLEILWENIGCLAPHHAVNIDGRLYAYAGGKLVRMGIGGEPEDGWSDPIQRHVSQFTTPADVVVGYDSMLKTFLCMYHGTLYPFHVTDEKWGAPLTIASYATGNVQSCVTVDNRLKITVNNAGTFSLYDFHVGPGSIWKAWTMWRDGGEPLRSKFIQFIGSVFQHDNLTFPDIVTNLYGTTATGSMDNVNPVRTITNTVTVLSPVAFAPRPKRRWARVRRAFALMMTGHSTLADSRPIKITIEGEVSETV